MTDIHQNMEQLITAEVRERTGQAMADLRVDLDWTESEMFVKAKPYPDKATGGELRTDILDALRKTVEAMANQPAEFKDRVLAAAQVHFQRLADQCQNERDGRSHQNIYMMPEDMQPQKFIEWCLSDASPLVRFAARFDANCAGLIQLMKKSLAGEDVMAEQPVKGVDGEG